MAKPRVFISSTYYDLRHVREQVAQFVKDQGYEAVLFERGEVAYGRKEAPEEYCYKEIDLCDILVSIVGGRYGAPSTSGAYSISQKELRHALEQGKQVYIFIERSVRTEYDTYLENKTTKKVRYKYADDRRVYQFIEELYALPRNNPIFTFESPHDIIDLLREQWAGLFQRLLQEDAERPRDDLIRDLKSAVTTLREVVSIVSAVNGANEKAVESILAYNHPAFTRVAKLLNINFRVVFSTLDELNTLMEGRRYRKVDERHWDQRDIMEWVKRRGEIQYLLKVPKSLFDALGMLRSASDCDDWSSIRLEKNYLSSVPDDELIPELLVDEEEDLEDE